MQLQQSCPKAKSLLIELMEPIEARRGKLCNLKKLIKDFTPEQFREFKYFSRTVHNPEAFYQGED